MDAPKASPELEALIQTIVERAKDADGHGVVIVVIDDREHARRHEQRSDANRTLNPWKRSSTATDGRFCRGRVGAFRHAATVRARRALNFFRVA